MVLCSSLNPSWFLVLWYFLLIAFVLFLITVSSSVNQGTELFVIDFFVVRSCLNCLTCRRLALARPEILQFIFRSVFLLWPFTQWYFQIIRPPSVLVVLSLSCSNLSRFPWNLTVFTFNNILDSLAFLFIPALWALSYCEFNDTVTRTAFFVTDFPLFHGSE